MTVHSPDTSQLNNWPYSQTSNPTQQHIQQEAPSEAEPMDVSIPDDLLNVIYVTEEELYLDYVSWLWNALRNQ